MKVLLFLTFVIVSICQIAEMQNCVVNKCIRTSVGTICKKDQQCKKAVNDAFNKYVTESQNKDNQECYNKTNVQELMPCFYKIVDQDAMNNDKFQQFIQCGQQCLENPQEMEKDKYYRRLISSANITKQQIIFALIIVLLCIMI